MEFAPGELTGGRYRIQRRVWNAGSGAVWLALDTILERPVLIQTFPGVDPAELSHAVARSAQITHPGLCQIYDVSADPPGIVFENAPGGRLADRKDGALPPAHAASICVRLAAAIGALHEHDMSHGGIGPGTVLFDEEGRPKLCAAMPVPEDDGNGAYRPADAAAGGEERDRYALGAIAYRLFTGREPGPDAPPARTAKRGIPPQVDALLSRALARDATARPALAEFRRVLEPFSTEEPHERGPGFFRQESSWLIPVLLVLALGIAAIAIAFGVQKVVTKSGGSTTPAPGASATPYVVSAVRDFDPPPQGNGEEHHDDVGLVIDGKDTAWKTYGYSTAALGGGKKGVGLLFDLGEARSVGRIEVRTPDPGWKAEWRTADSEGAAANAYTIAQSFTAPGPIVLGRPVTARYWLLWITRLVDSGTGDAHPYQAQVSEVAFFPRQT
jgi:hypothetical protein